MTDCVAPYTPDCDCPECRHCRFLREEAVSAFYCDLGTRIRQARSRMGITQAELATNFGLARSSIANLEGGRQRPPLHTVVEMAGALGVEVPGLATSSSSRLTAMAMDRAQAECHRLREALEAISRVVREVGYPVVSEESP